MVPEGQGVGYRVSGGQGVGLQGPRGSRGRPTRSQEVKGKAYKVPGGQGGRGKMSHRINSDI